MSKPSREEIEQHLVPLMDVSSVYHASELANKLQRAGIIALAKIDAYGKPCVVVHTNDLDRARAMVDSSLAAEGSAPMDQILQQFREAQVDPDWDSDDEDDLDDDESHDEDVDDADLADADWDGGPGLKPEAMQWYHDQKEADGRKDRRLLLIVVVFVGILILAGVAIEWNSG